MFFKKRKRHKNKRSAKSWLPVIKCKKNKRIMGMSSEELSKLCDSIPLQNRIKVESKKIL